MTLGTIYTLVEVVVDNLRLARENDIDKGKYIEKAEAVASMITAIRHEESKWI